MFAHPQLVYQNFVLSCLLLSYDICNILTFMIIEKDEHSAMDMSLMEQQSVLAMHECPSM